MLPLNYMRTLSGLTDKIAIIKICLLVEKSVVNTRVSKTCFFAFGDNSKSAC